MSRILVFIIGLTIGACLTWWAADMVDASRTHVPAPAYQGNGSGA